LSSDLAALFICSVGLTQTQIDVRKAMDTMNILLRNVEACLHNAKHKRESSRRVRFNHAKNQTQKKLYARDLGAFVIEFARVIRELSLALSELSNLFIQDPKLEQNTDQYTNAKLLIQVRLSTLLLAFYSTLTL